jgi:hypothetical protein
VVTSNARRIDHMTGPKQTCPSCGKDVTTVQNKQANFRQYPKVLPGTPTHRQVSTTYTYACQCGKVFTRIVPVK